MKTLNKKSTRERREYATELSKLPHHLKRLKVPPQAIVHFWYESPSPKTPLKKADWKEQLRKIAGIWEDYDNAQEVFQDIRASFNNRIPQ